MALEVDVILDEPRGDVASLVAGGLAAVYLVVVASLAALLCALGDVAVLSFVEALALARTARRRR